MNCVILSKSKVQAKVISNILLEFKIESQSLYSKLSLGIDFVSQIRNAIRKSDFAIIYYSGKSYNISLEIGICLGLGKRIFLVLPINEGLPSNLAGLEYVRSSENDYSKLKNAIKSFLEYSILPRKEKNEQLLFELIKSDSNDQSARIELSRIYRRQNKWKEAEYILQECLAIDPKQLQVRTELSKIYQHQKKWKEAEYLLQECLAIDPKQLQVRTELSKIYQHQNKWKEAEYILQESLTIDPKQLQVRIELSKIYQHQNKWKEAKYMLQECLAIDPNQLHARTELSKIYQHQKNWKEAEYLLQKCLAIDPKQLQVRIELSKIYQHQNKWKEAEYMLQESLAIDPEQLFARIELSKIYQLQKKWNQAEQILIECLSIYPEQLQVRIELSKIYQYQKKWNKAEIILLEILEFDNHNKKAVSKLRQLYRFSNDIEKSEILSKGRSGQIELLSILEIHKKNRLQNLKKRLSSLSSNSQESFFEDIIDDLFRILNIQALRENRTQGTNVDFSLWIDDLTISIGNPIIVETKFSNIEKGGLKNSVEQLSNFINKTNANAGIIIYYSSSISVLNIRSSSCPNVYAISLKELIDRLMESTFSEVLLELRDNAKA